MAFPRWVRRVSEQQLMTAAQTKVARRYGIAAPPRPTGGDLLWQKVCAPVVHALPGALRDKVAATMPGSHRRTWHRPAQASGPAATLLQVRETEEHQGMTSGG